MSKVFFTGVFLFVALAVSAQESETIKDLLIRLEEG